MNNQANKNGKKDQNLKTGMAAGAGVVGGVAAGVVAGTAVGHAEETHDNEEIIAEVDTNKVETPAEPVQEVHHHHHTTTHHTTNNYYANEPQATTQGGNVGAVTPQDPGNIEEPVTPIENNGGEDPSDIEVLDYQRVDDGQGGQMDVAVIGVEGQPIMVIDENIDGYADFMASDFNQNGEIEEDEIIDVRGQGIAMQPMQEAAGFVETGDPMANVDDMPDYVNDADVDSFMA